MTSTRRPYGHLPREMRPHLPRMVQLLKEEGITRPYDFIGRLFDVSPSRIQQVVLGERRKMREANRVEVTQQAHELSSRHTPA